MDVERRDELEFGIKIKRLRMRAKLSLTNMADQLGLSVSFLSRVECGQKHRLSGYHLFKFCNITGGDPDDLMLAGGRCPDDILSILQARPEFAALLRDLQDSSSATIGEIGWRS
jgi:transcriptional regulator with XRE-family HTH domain